MIKRILTVNEPLVVSPQHFLWFFLQNAYKILTVKAKIGIAQLYRNRKKKWASFWHWIETVLLCLEVKIFCQSIVMIEVLPQYRIRKPSSRLSLCKNVSSSLPHPWSRNFKMFRYFLNRPYILFFTAPELLF